MDINVLLDLESNLSFNFFWNEANCDKKSPGFGLIRDRAPGSKNIASIASVGFGLSALAIGAERGYIPRSCAYERALGTLNTILYNVDNVYGFYYHFLYMDNGKRALKSEVSIIDTAIAVNGAILCGEYFGGEIKEKAYKIYSRINWDWFVDKKRELFYMSYTPEKGFSGWWDFYAEQLMLYILASGSPTYRTNPDLLYKFFRNTVSCPGSEAPFINSWYGSIFTYQFSHAWFDFRNKKDLLGIDWWENSVNAIKANRQYCIDMGEYFKTFHSRSWGLTPCDGPWGYNGRYGTAPSGIINTEHVADGTVPPAGPAGSISFVPEESKEALLYMYSNHEKLWSKYGFKDAYNLDVDHKWYASNVIGIDKGISLLMIENYRTEFIWSHFMKNPYILQGMKLCGLTSDQRGKVTA